MWKDWKAEYLKGLPFFFPPSPLSRTVPSQLSSTHQAADSVSSTKQALGARLRAAWSLPALEEVIQSYFCLGNHRFTWSRSFRRAILLVTSSWARSSFSCSNLMLASCNLRFSLCRKRATARGGALVPGRTLRNKWNWGGKTSNGNNKVNFWRCEKGKAQVAQEGRAAVWETTVG